ncbi:MAG: HepT-like ribonuclease domain-containing protein [Chloroflexota bacterium]
MIRNLEVVDEAVKRLSTEFRSQHPDVPWRRIAGLRDILIHSYDGVVMDRVWGVVDAELPRLAVSIARIVAAATDESITDG